MAWVTPTNRATGYLVTATIWNEDVVANPSYLKGLAGDVTIEDDVIIQHSTDIDAYLQFKTNGTVRCGFGWDATEGITISEGTSFGSGRNILTYASGNLTFTTANSVQFTIDDDSSGTSAVFNVLRDGGNQLFMITEAPLLLLNDTSNASMTIGITINQGASDDEIMAVKSSDVAHGMTSLAETDTFGTIQKFGAADGGIQLRGLTEVSTAIYLSGCYTTDTATRSTAGIAPIMLVASLKSGTSVGNPAADKNIVAFASGSNTRHILDSDGDSHQDVGTAWTNFDDRDDVEALNLLAAHVTRKDDPLRAGLGRWLAENREPLERAKLVEFNADGHHFVNMSRLSMLLVGAARQLGDRVAQLERRLLVA